MPIVCDQHGVLMLCGVTAVLGDDCPPVPPHLPGGVSIHKDGLHGEGHAGLHGEALTVAPRVHLHHARQADSDCRWIS